MTDDRSKVEGMLILESLLCQYDNQIQLRLTAYNAELIIFSALKS